MQGIRPLVLIFLAAAGCASDPALRDNEVSSTVRIQTGDGQVMETATSEGAAVREFPITAQVAEAWNALPSAFESMGFEPTRGDRRGRILGFENVRLRRINGNRPSRYLDCGQGVTGPNADSYDVFLSLLAQVAPSAEGATLRVRTLASAQNSAHGGNAVRCGTNGRLEEDLADALRSALNSAN